MDTFYEEDEEYYCKAMEILLIIVICAATAKLKRDSRAGRLWVSPLLRRRQERGVWNSIIPDLVGQPGAGRVLGTFSYYFRMDTTCFEDILSKISPVIARQDNHLRQAIPPAQRLAVTLRYLATGCSFTELYYNFRISVASLSSIIPETCAAIYNSLRVEYLTTPNTVEQWTVIRSVNY